MTVLGRLTCHNLCVEHLENVKLPEDAERAGLRDNSELRLLDLSWTHEGIITEKKPDAEKGLLVLDKLIPPRTLEHLALCGYMSKNFPNWMVDIFSYLPYLKAISLVDLTSCNSLPPFGRMPNLRALELKNIPNIRKIGKEFYGEEGTCKRLRKIDFRSLENLEELWTTRSGDEDEEFLIPNLHQLGIKNCPKLKLLPYPPKSLYWTLEESNEVLPKHGFGRLSSSTHPFSAKIQSRSFSIGMWRRLQYLATLEELEISSRGSSLSLSEDALCFPSLKKLVLLWCRLEIQPECLGQLTTLEVLRIGLCELTCLPESIRNLTALKRLDFFYCPELTCLPESIRNLTALKGLDIWFCPTLARRCKGEDAYKISHIPEVVFDGVTFVPGRPVQEPEWSGDVSSAVKQEYERWLMLRHS